MVGHHRHHQNRYDLEDHREAFIIRWRARLGSKGAKQVSKIIQRTILCKIIINFCKYRLFLMLQLQVRIQQVTVMCVGQYRIIELFTMYTLPLATAESVVDFRVNYPMIKYPRRVLGLPNEKLFKMDTQNMVAIMFTIIGLKGIWISKLLRLSDSLF